MIDLVPHTPALSALLTALNLEVGEEYLYKIDILDTLDGVLRDRFIDGLEQTLRRMEELGVSMPADADALILLVKPIFKEWLIWIYEGIAIGATAILPRPQD